MRRTNANFGFQELEEVLRMLGLDSTPPYRKEEVVEAFARKGTRLA
jgi:hypothetical protein